MRAQGPRLMLIMRHFSGLAFNKGETHMQHNAICGGIKYIMKRRGDWKICYSVQACWACWENPFHVKKLGAVTSDTAQWFGIQGRGGRGWRRNDKTFIEWG